MPVVKRPEAPALIRDGHIDRLLDRWFDDFRHLFRLPRLWGPERWVSTRELMQLQMPAVDVYEEKNEVVVKADLPGMAKDSLDVSLSDGTLTIKGEKRKEEKIEDADYYRVERSYGAFARSLRLPAGVKADAVKACFKDGVLEVRLPKSGRGKQKETKIPVQ